MVTLTLQDKKALMEMLHKHYSIDESAFIKAITENEEEEVELTLKAFSLAQRTQEAKAKLVQEDNSEFQTVQIDHLDSKLALVKAIKETTELGLVECKAIADQIVSFSTDAKYVFTPFKVGVNNNGSIRTGFCTFTTSQWLAICDYLRKNCGINTIKWHYA